MSKERSRWTYDLGSRPEGVILYDAHPNGGSQKFHSHHDTDKARGQQNAWDLCRLALYGNLDEGAQHLPITERPSSKAMHEFARSQPEIQQALAAESFEDLGPLPPDPFVSSDKFHIYNALEFSAGPPMEWIVRDILPRAEMAVVYGESGSGKSFWVLDLCAAVTRGIEWRGKRTKPGKVVYVCAEGAGGFKSRLKAYMQTFEAEQLPAVIPAAPNLLEAKDPALLIETLLAWGKTDVIVIDTLSAATPGGNENAGEDMGKAISHCKAIHAATGALVVLVHHSGKDAAKGARGWSGLKAATDAEIEITRNGQLRCATISKMKDGEDGPTMPFKLTRVLLGFDADGEELSSCVVEHTDEMPELRTKKKLSSKQNTVLNILRIMHVSGTTVDVGDLYDGVRKADPEFKRKRDFDSALAGLVDAGYASLDDGRVGLLGAVAAPDEDWLE